MKVGVLAILLWGRFLASSPNSAHTEMQHLVRSLSGEWSIEFRVNPSDALRKGGSGRGHEVWKSGPGGMSFVEEYQSTGDEGDITGRATFWWDEHFQRIQVLWCANYLPGGCEMMSEGASWDGNHLVLGNRWDSGGRTHFLREIFSDILPTSFTQTIYQGESLEKLSVTHVFRATKICCGPPSEQ
jgi:hypothetical protein